MQFWIGYIHCVQEIPYLLALLLEKIIKKLKENFRYIGWDCHSNSLIFLQVMKEKRGIFLWIRCIGKLQYVHAMHMQMIFCWLNFVMMHKTRFTRSTHDNILNAAVLCIMTKLNIGRKNKQFGLGAWLLIGKRNTSHFPGLKRVFHYCHCQHTQVACTADHDNWMSVGIPLDIPLHPLNIPPRTYSPGHGTFLAWTTNFPTYRTFHLRLLKRNLKIGTDPYSWP